jgi:multisubunit Na+/H+ antiporter MnhB subunit
MAKRMPEDSPPQRRSMAESALLGGGALLITTSVIHLLLWSESYRDITPIGPILVLMGIIGILLAVAVIRFGTLGLGLAGALYLAVSTALLLLASRLELLGFEEGSPAPFTARSIIVPIVGMALLGGLAWLISPPQRKPKFSKGSADSAADRALEPSTLIPQPDDGIERLRWPAEREKRMQLVSELPPEPEPVVEEQVVPEPIAKPLTAQEIILDPEPIEEPVTVREVGTEPELVEVDEPLPEPAVAEVEAEPAAELEDEIEPPHEPTEELAAVVEPVPDSIPEPQRSMLIREHEILEMVTRAQGADDPGTLNIRGNIADYYLAAGDVWRAADMQEAVAADSARILGDAHPHTMTAQGKARQYRKLAKKKKRPKVPVG